MAAVFDRKGGRPQPGAHSWHVRSEGIPEEFSGRLRAATSEALRSQARDIQTVCTSSLLHQAGSGDLLIAADRRIDPALGAWLDTHCSVAGKIQDEGERLAYLTEAVRHAFSYTGKTFLRRGNNQIFKLLQERESKDAVLLGDFIHNRTGVCRHGALLLQLACQMTGLPSIIQYGSITPLDPVTGRADGEPTPHVWNVVTVRLSGDALPFGQAVSVRIADFARGIAQIERFSSLLGRKELREIYGTDSARDVVRFSESDLCCYRTEVSARTFNRSLDDKFAQQRVEFALRNSIQPRD